MKQKIVIKVQIRCGKCRKKAMKIAAGAEGVISVSIQGSEKDEIVVVGIGVDSAGLCSSLRKKLSYANLLSVEEVKDPKPEEKKKEEKPKENKKEEEKKQEEKKEEKQEKKKQEEKKEEKEEVKKSETKEASQAEATIIYQHHYPPTNCYPPTNHCYPNPPQCYLYTTHYEDNPNPNCTIM